MCCLHGGYPDLYREETRRANREHRCCACRETIRRGDRYVVIAGKWDGEFQSFKQCLRCHVMMTGICDVTGDVVDIQLDCGAEPFEPGEAPQLEYLAFLTRDEYLAFLTRDEAQT